MSNFAIRETTQELSALERQNPAMGSRLRWLRMLKIGSNLSPNTLVNQTGVLEYEMDRWAALYQSGGVQLLLNPLTLLEDTVAQAKTFSDHAEDELKKLRDENAGQLGRKLWIDFDFCRRGKPKDSTTECSLFGNYKDFEAQFKNWRRTDCQTYIQDVIRYAYEKIGRRDLYNGLLKFYKTRDLTNGTVMAEYLVKNGWKAYLFMPDTEQPFDDNKDHTTMYKTALKTETWWKVPLSGFIVNYKPTIDTEMGRHIAKPTALDEGGKKKLAALANVKFGACVFTGARHTGILSRGEILEVHWKNISEQRVIDEKYRGFQTYDEGKLYDSTPLIDFGWVEGIIVIPPDSNVAIV